MREMVREREREFIIMVLVIEWGERRWGSRIWFLFICFCGKGDLLLGENVDLMLFVELMVKKFYEIEDLFLILILIDLFDLGNEFVRGILFLI